MGPRRNNLDRKSYLWFWGFKQMSKSNATAATFMLFVGLAVAIPGSARAATCPFGGDEIPVYALLRLHEASVDGKEMEA